MWNWWGSGTQSAPCRMGHTGDGDGEGEREAAAGTGGSKPEGRMFEVPEQSGWESRELWAAGLLGTLREGASSWPDMSMHLAFWDPSHIELVTLITWCHVSVCTPRSFIPVCPLQVLCVSPSPCYIFLCPITDDSQWARQSWKGRSHYLSLSKSDSRPHMYHRTGLPPVSCIIRLGCCVNLPWKTAFPSTLWKSQLGRSLLLQRCHALLEKQDGYFIPLDFSVPAFPQPHSAMRSKAKAHPCRVTQPWGPKYCNFPNTIK